MKKINASLASLVVMTALATPALAIQNPVTQPAQPAPSQPAPVQDDEQKPKLDMTVEQAEEKTTATGRLVSVSTDEMTIVIKGADEQEHEFRYTDRTMVVGAEEQISGLSTKAGSLVTVHFTQGTGDTRIATKVEFDKKK
ncbi:hypothetical protein [Luteitalea sp.]